MINKRKNFPELVKDVRSQLGLSKEELVHEGVSFATLNHWENAKTSPSMLVYRQFDAFSKFQPISCNCIICHNFTHAHELTQGGFHEKKRGVRDFCML